MRGVEFEPLEAGLQGAFGRGPEGQVWEFFESLPDLLATCRSLLADRPLFIVMTAYGTVKTAVNGYRSQSLNGLWPSRSRCLMTDLMTQP